MNCSRLILTGRVQGVGFRFFVRAVANNLGLKGTVQNIDHDKVEIVVEGEEEKIDQLKEECKKGPPLSTVLDIKEEKKEANNKFQDFRII